MLMTLTLYDKENLEGVSKIIVDNLTPDLLPKKWRKRNSITPMFGHCHTASACLQKVFGTKNIKLYRAKDDEDIWHWWCVDANGKRIDLTADQYYNVGRTPPYEQGEKASILGWGYKKRVHELLERVEKVLDNIK
jgi:hypothetical protein